jgi:transposase-like protein
MASKQYTDEFKAEAVKQVTERGFAVAEVAKRLGSHPTAFTNGSARPSARPWRARQRGRCCRRPGTQPRCVS